MVKWSLDDKTLILNGENHNSNIRRITNSLKCLHIEKSLRTCPVKDGENQPMQKKVRINSQKDCGKQTKKEDTMVSTPSDKEDAAISTSSDKEDTTISTLSDKNQKESTLAVVEYNNGNYYLGVLVEKRDTHDSPIANLLLPRRQMKT